MITRPMKEHNYILITHPRAHREDWINRHPHSLIENGGILSRSDLARWACDKCMAPLNPERPIRVIGGSEGLSMCDTCAPSPAQVEYTDCTCPGCKSQR